MDKELLELFEAAKKAADAATVDGDAEESRCLDALRQLKNFPVTYQLLVTTQVGKRLRHLTKHPKRSIQAFSCDLIDMWKDIVIKETAKSKKADLDCKDSAKVELASADTSKAEKLQKSSSMRAEKASKAETLKIERVDQNGVLGSVKVSRTEIAERKLPNAGVVKVEKTNSLDKVKVEKINREEKQTFGAKKSSLNPAAPPKLTSMIKSNDAMRDKIRDLLFEALSKVPGEADEDSLDEVNACDPIRVAVSVESVMFEKWGGSNGAQKAKYRSLMFNLKDPKNPDFRRRVLLGHVKPERLVTMSSAEMASDQRQRENQEIEQKALFDCERGGAPKATTDQFKCGRCGQRKCTYYQMQTRSADEPMTTYVTCVNCNNHWKFC